MGCASFSLAKGADRAGCHLPYHKRLPGYITCYIRFGSVLHKGLAMAKDGKRLFSLQVSDEMLARWKESAAARSMSVAALIHEGMEAVLDADANDEIPIPPPIPLTPPQ